MTLPTREELLWRFGKTDDPEINARQDRITEVLLEANPQRRQRFFQKAHEEGHEEGQLTAARAFLRQVLARQGITPSAADDARIEACSDIPTLQCWIDRAFTASRISEALE